MVVPQAFCAAGGDGAIAREAERGSTASTLCANTALLFAGQASAGEADQLGRISAHSRAGRSRRCHWRCSERCRKRPSCRPRGVARHAAPSSALQRWRPRPSARAPAQPRARAARRPKRRCLRKGAETWQVKSGSGSVTGAQLPLCRTGLAQNPMRPRPTHSASTRLTLSSIQPRPNWPAQPHQASPQVRVGQGARQGQNSAV